MSDPFFDQAMASEMARAKGTTLPVDDTFAQMLEQEQLKKQALAGSLTQAVTVNPDQYNAQVRTAQYLGYPTAAVEALPDLANQAKVKRIEEDTANSPALQQAYTDADFAKLAHDDSGVLASVGQFFSDTGGSMKAGVFNASKGSAGVFRAGLELVAPIFDKLEDVPSIGGNPLRRLAEGFGKLGDDAGATAKAAAPKTDGVLSGGFQSGIQSLTQNLLAMPMAFFPGGQPAALTMMTANTGGQSYQDARDKGLSMSQALPFAASQAAIEYATEKMPLDALIGGIKAGAPFLQTLLKQMALEIPGEQVATVLQDLNEWAVLNPGKPFKSYIDERPNAFAQTLIATIVGTGGNVVIAKGVEAATKKLMGDAYDAGQADLGAENLQNALKTATQSKLRERNPDEFRTLVQKMAESTDGAPTEVFVDAEVLNQLAPEVLAQLPSVAAQMADALAANDVVSIPVGDVLTVAPGTPLEAMLIENARIGDPRAMSQAEAKDAGAKAQEFLAQESARVIQQAVDQQAMQESSDRVRQGVLDQLNAVGRFRKDVNEGYATWTAAFYTTMAGRLGVTPEEMQAKYPLNIVGKAEPGSQVMDQPGTPAFDQWFGESKVVDAQGKPIVVYHGTGKDFGDVFNTQGGNGKTFDTGSFFSARPATADTYAVGETPNTMPVYLSLKTPLVIDAGGANWDNIAQKAKVEMPAIESVYATTQEDENLLAELEGREPEKVKPTKKKARKTNVRDLFKGEWDYPDDTASTDDIARWARKQGYDGVVFRNVKDHGPSGAYSSDEARAPADLFVVFDPTQIKSATGNNGNYDATDPNILHQSASVNPVATLTGKEFGDAVTGKDLRGVVTDFAKTELVGKSFTNKETGVGIVVPWQSIKHAISNANEPELKLVHALPQILESSSYAGSEPDKLGRPDIVAVHKYLAPVTLAGEPLTVGVVVREMRDGHRFYDHFIVGNKNPAGISESASEQVQTLGDQPTAGFDQILNQSGQTFNQSATPGFDQTQTEAFKRFTNDAPVVTSEAAEGYAFKTGQKVALEAYHGTARPDRVGTVFQKKRATSGPMAFFTSNPELASSYAKGKADTSLASEDQDYANWFKFKPQGQRSSVDLVRAWYLLTPEQKTKIAELAPRVTYGEEQNEDSSNKIVLADEGHTNGTGSYDYNLQQTQRGYDKRGNPLKALVEDWLNSGNLFNDEEQFLKVLQLAGFPVKDITYDSPHSAFPFVYKTYIEMQKPLVTSDIPQEVTDALLAAAKKDRSRSAPHGADMWDKNTRTLKEWVANFVDKTNDQRAYVWTSIPDKVIDVFKSFGYDGIVDWSGKGGGHASPVYIPFNETQVKSAIGNKGKFDSSKKDILKQDARATFNPKTLELALNESADLSSFLHETGHFFLEVMADLAAQPDAPADIASDMAALMKWFGVTDTATWNAMSLDEKRPYHERFAESFEQYLLEGKAPSLELQPLFRKFRAWMLNVYKSLKAFVDGRAGATDIQLSDEVRQVFDRMLASEEQIAQANEVAGLLPNEEADAEAVEKLTARSLRDLKWTVNARAKAIKALQKQAASLRKEVQAEVTLEVNQMPEFLAKEMLDKTRKENKEQLNDTELTIIADAFGYPDVNTMLLAIDAAGKKSDVIQGMTDQRMLERHGDLIDQRAVEAAANEAVHNEARARSLATELRSQGEMLNPRTDTGEVNANGSKITVNAIVEAAKQFAANVIAKTPLRDLKAKAWQHTAAERRAGKRWQEHTAKGETQEAVKAKQDQVLNNAAAKAAMDAQLEMRKILEFFKRVIKDNNEKVVDKGRDPDVVNAARAVLAAYGVAPKAGKTALEYMALVEKNDPAMFAALAPSVQGAINLAQPLDALTMEQLRGLHEEIQGMWHLAKRSRQMEVDGNMMDIEDAVDQLQVRMQAVGVPLTMPGESGAMTPREEIARKVQHAGSLLRRVEQWAEGLDGKFGGPFLKLVFQPIKDAADRYRSDRVKYRKAYQALVDNVAPSLTKGLIEAPELGYTFGKGHNGIGHAELLHAILHTGNESNKRKLLLGRNWAVERQDGTLDTERWDRFLQRMHDTGVLNKTHYDFAQGVWDLLEQTKPLAQKTHRDVFGRYFAEVTADAFTTPFGDYAGGYVPAQADPRIVQDSDLRKLAEAENENMSFSFPGTNKGFTKGRVEYNRPLMLDLRSIGQHLDKVLLFSHMEPAVRDVQKLLSQKGVSMSLGRIDPTAYAGMLTPWLNRSARQIVETPIVGDGGISRILSAARSRAGMSLMFANVSNTIQQITGFSLAAVKVKPSSMMRATAQFIAHPKQMAKVVSDASAFMANRMENEISAINDAMDAILLNPNLYRKSQAWTQKHAYFLQTAMANTMEPIIWTGAYNDALADGQSEKDAVRFADNVVRTTQGSTLPEDVSQIETGPAYARIFTQFIGYFNMMANTNATALKQISMEMGLKKGAGKALGVVGLGFLIPIWIAEAIAQAMRGGPDDPDDDGYLDDWLAAVFGMGTLKGSLAMVPFVGQLGNAAMNRFNNNPADDKVSLSPAVSIIEASAGVPRDVYLAMTDPDKLNKRNAVRDVASLVSIATGLPAVALARPLGYLAGVATDKIDPTGPVDMARGVVTGTPSPESK